MNTIRGKIKGVLVISLIFTGLITLIFSRNNLMLQQKLVSIENFDDLFNNILELRRYEKNFIYYRDWKSFDEATYYYSIVEELTSKLRYEIIQEIGEEGYEDFISQQKVYIALLKDKVESIKQGITGIDFNDIREAGKDITETAQKLIQQRRARIDRVLRHNILLPIIAFAVFVVLMIIIYTIVSRGILRPLILLEHATKTLSTEYFEPISYPEDRKDEISRLVKAFNKMAEELEIRQEQLLQSKKMASIGTFTSGIAHELNNPINNISLIVESLMENESEMTREERMKLYADLMLQADRTSEIVKNLLEFTRARFGKIEKVSLEKLIDKTVQLIKNELKLHQIVFTKVVKDEIPEIEVDPGGLQQVFLNMFVNAIQAIEKNGEIKVTLSLLKGKNEIRIDIEDNGSGIAQENLKSIFDPFFTTKSEGQGTGLGLAVSFNIIQKHQGRIEVQSELGKGTCFSIFLPIKNEKST